MIGTELIFIILIVWYLNLWAGYTVLADNTSAVRMEESDAEYISIIIAYWVMASLIGVLIWINERGDL